MVRNLSIILFCLIIVFCTNEVQSAERGESNSEPVTFASTDWPWWRGPTRNGIAAANQNPPLEWSKSKNVLWQMDIPGRGHGSPTVVGSQVFLATAELEPEVQSVLCFDRKTGKQLWKTVIHRSGVVVKKLNKKASYASSSIACDGERLFINFLNDGAVYTTALTRDGKQIWQTKITDYVLHQGYGSSPAVYQSLVIVSADNKAGGAIAALDRSSGDIVWRSERPKTPNYASPVILSAEGRDQLLFTGCNLVSSFNPLTGKKLWEVEGSTTECVTSIVTDGNLVFTSGGYPKNHISAVQADGSGKIVWENNTRVYVPSMFVLDGFLYGILDAGVAACWNCETGVEAWKSRLGGTFSASPVLVGDRIYVTNESGETLIYKASPDKFELLNKNQLGDEVFATPTICDCTIFMRAASQQSGKRQEMLYCIGERD